MHAFAHWIGLDNGAGGQYLFWSGFCGDLIYLSAFAVLWRHLNCHVDGCRRFGFHPVHGTRFKVCRRHHPNGGNTLEHVHAMADQ